MIKNKNIFLNLIPIVALLTVLSCSTGPEFERDNENDPSGKFFIPDRPVGPNSRIEGNNLIINWEITTDNAEGIIVEKKIHEEQITVLSDTVNTNISEYVDESGTFGYPTNYYIYTYSGEQLSDPLIITPQIWDTEELSYSIENGILIISREPSYFNISELKIERSSESETQSSVYFEKNVINTFEIPIKENLTGTGLVHDFVFTQIYKNEYGTSSPPPSNFNDIFPTCPINFNSEILNENTLELGWYCLAQGFDELKLFVESEGNRELLGNIKSSDSSFIYTNNLEYDDKYLFSFETSIEGNNIVIFESEITIQEPEPIIEDIKIIADEVILTVDQSNNRAATYDILQGYRGYDFKVIGSIPPEQNMFKTVLPDIPGCVNSECERDIWFEYKLTSRISPESKPVPILYGLELVQKQTPFELKDYLYGENNFGILPVSDDFFGFNNTNNETIIVDTETNSVVARILNDSYFPFLRFSRKNQNKLLLSDLSSNTIIKKLPDGEKISMLDHTQIGELYDAFFWQTSSVILAGSNGLFIWSLTDNKINKITSSYSKSDPSIITFNTYTSPGVDGVLAYFDGDYVRVFANDDGNFSPYFEFKNSLDSPIVDILSITSDRTFYFLHENGALTVNDHYRYSEQNFEYLPSAGEISTLNKFNNTHIFFFNNTNGSASFISTVSNSPAYRKAHQELNINKDHFYKFVAPGLPSTIFGLTIQNSSANFRVEFFKFDFQIWKADGFEIVDW